MNYFVKKLLIVNKCRITLKLNPIDSKLINEDRYEITCETQEQQFSDVILTYNKASIIASNCTIADNVNEVNRTSKGLVSSSALISNFLIFSLSSEYSIANAVIVKPSKEEKIEMQALQMSFIVF